MHFEEERTQFVLVDGAWKKMIEELRAFRIVVENCALEKMLFTFKEINQMLE
jgi:hypothetical protein